MSDGNESTTWVVEPLHGDAEGDDPTLVMIAGPEIGRHIALDQASMTVGRDPEAELSIQMPGVSRRHCEFVTKDGSVGVRDLGSTNGTWVNQKRLAADMVTALDRGDIVHAGGIAFKLVGGGDLEQEYHEAVHNMMFLDGLTGARNRRFLMDLLSREIPRCLRHQRPLAVMILDVDHFKEINDTRGHLAGDDVSRGLVERVNEITREEDSITRYGGDEFIVVMPESEIEGARIYAQRVCDVVAERGFESDGQRIQATVSIGVAELTDERDTPEKLIAAADQALYEAKARGRNGIA